MQLEIESYRRVGPLTFGMTAVEVRSVMRLPVEPFKRSMEEGYTDAFGELGIYVTYDRLGLCEAVEIASPAQPTFRGREILGRPFKEVHESLLKLDPELDVDDTGLTALGLGIGVYAPGISEDPSTPVEAVIAFKRGYYDD